MNRRDFTRALFGAATLTAVYPAKKYWDMGAAWKKSGGVWRPVVSIIDFGAVPGGPDCTEAIQAAIDHAHQVGGKVVIPEGSYRISAPIAMPTHRYYVNA